MTDLKINEKSSTMDFVAGKWQSEINVRDFIQKNYTPYYGDSSFLAEPTEATLKLWDECCDLFKQERENGGVLDLDTKIVSSIVSNDGKYNFSIFEHPSNALLLMVLIVFGIDIDLIFG